MEGAGLEHVEPDPGMTGTARIVVGQDLVQPGADDVEAAVEVVSGFWLEAFVDAKVHHEICRDFFEISS